MSEENPTMYAYVRISNKRESGENSLARQQTIIREGAHRMCTPAQTATKYNIVCVGEIGSAYNENSEKRRVWTHIVEVAVAGDIIVCSSVDRAGRSWCLLETFANLQKRGVDVWFVEPNIKWSTSTTDIAAHIARAVGESDVYSKRAKQCAEFQRTHNGYMGRAPIGYQIHTNTSGVREKQISTQMRDAITQIISQQKAMCVMNDSLCNITIDSQEYEYVDNVKTLDEIEHMRTAIVGAVMQHDATKNTCNTLARAQKVLLLMPGVCSVCECDTDESPLTCNGCYTKVHLGCVSKYPYQVVGSWYCQTCRESGIDEQCICLVCQLCKNGNSYEHDLLMLCDTCGLGFHESCSGEQNTDDTSCCVYCANVCVPMSVD